MSKKKPTKPKSGRTTAQLEAENERLRAKIDRLAVGDTLRFEGEEWFQTIEYFDPEGIERIPSPPGIGNVYLMGYVEDVWVIEVPKETPVEELHAFNEQLRAMGVTAPFLTITNDMKFLKLARVSEARTVELDQAELKTAAEAMAQRDELIRAALERAEQDAAIEAPSAQSGQCPDCGEPGFGDHGCVYCGHGRRAPDAGARSELHGDGLGGDRSGAGSSGSGGGDPHREGEGEGAVERG